MVRTAETRGPRVVAALFARAFARTSMCIFNLPYGESELLHALNPLVLALHVWPRAELVLGHARGSVPFDHTVPVRVYTTIM